MASFGVHKQRNNAWFNNVLLEDYHINLSKYYSRENYFHSRFLQEFRLVGCLVEISMYASSTK